MISRTPNFFFKFIIFSMRLKYKSDILESARSASSNFTGMLVPRFWLGIYSIVTSISKMCLHKMCATLIHNKSNNYIFHTISNQYQFILDVLPFSQQTLSDRKICLLRWYMTYWKLKKWAFLQTQAALWLEMVVFVQNNFVSGKSFVHHYKRFFR